MALIIDTSSYQGKVDWKAVLASGRAGAITKATEALGYVDPTFAANWAALGQLQATRGAYCFARPDKAVPEATADKFLAVVGTVQPADILVLDLEVGSGDLSGWALTWLSRVEARTGIKPWLYSYAPFIRAHLQDPALSRYPLWLASYQSSPPAAPPPWTSYVLWQHTDKANVPGVSGLCDESTGTLAVPPPVPPAPGGAPVANAPFAAILVHPGGGYLEIGEDGGVFGFGGAPFYGSLGGTKLNQPIVAAEWSPTFMGYYLLGRDGGIFAFGDAVHQGNALWGGS